MNEASDFSTLLAPVWRRKWLVLAIAIVVAGATYVYYHRQAHVYSASTTLDLGAGLEAQQLNSVSAGRAALNNRALADAAALIASGAVSESVKARLHREGRSDTKLGKVRAKAAGESYMVTVTAEAHSAKQAARLANDYALAYIERQHDRYRSQVQSAIARTRHQLRRIEAAQAVQTKRQSAAGTGKRGSSRASGGDASLGGSAVIQAASLASKISQLESDLSVASVQQVSPALARNAKLVSPQPTRNAIFGFVLGLLLAALAALAIGRIDRRVHTIEQLRAIFNARSLAALPRESAPIDYRDDQPKPADTLVEPLRRLHTAIQFEDVLEPAGASRSRAILFVSPENGDGKSTLVADLALAQRDAGARVAVIEADLRRPSLAPMLSIDDSVGLTDVLAGDIDLGQALRRVGAAPVRPAGPGNGAGGVSTLVRAPSAGSLSVLAAGRHAPNPPALLASEEMRELLRAATAEHDYVLIDAPPPLQVSDAMPLMHWVDGIVIVARMEHTRQDSARHLARLLADSSTAPVLGVVANAVSRAEIGRGGFAASRGQRR